MNQNRMNIHWRLNFINFDDKIYQDYSRDQMQPLCVIGLSTTCKSSHIDTTTN